jgi:hypothetical protein
MKSLFLTLLVCLGGCTTPSQTTEMVMSGAPLAQKELVEVRGSAVSFGISSFISISCVGFEKQFSDASPILITDTATLHQINTRLKGLHEDPNMSGVNIRAKVVLTYQDQSRDTLCLGKFTSYYRHRVVAEDTVLNHLLGVGF